MRRRSYGGFRKPRAKKIRSPIRVKPRIAKVGGKCDGCKLRFAAGAEITYVIVRKRKYHTLSCVPVNVGQMPAAAGGGPLIASPDAVVKALSTNWTIGESKMTAMLALENALVVVAKNKGITPEMEKAFDRYNKLKGMAMRPGSQNEGEIAARLAIIEVVKAVF